MRRLAALAALTALLLVAIAAPASADFGMPDALTDRGREIESIYDRIFLAGTVVFLVVFVLLAWVVWRYREGSGHGRATHERERHNLKAEMLWTGVPLLIVLWVGLISYQGLAKLDHELTAEDAEMEIRVIGSQWTWMAHYGQHVSLYSDPSSTNGSVAAANEFLVPANVPILWNVTSSDVIHAWHIADANHATVLLVDANPYGPHKYNTFVIRLPEGVYPVQCREMCLNPGHAYMRATVRAVPQAQFDHWFQGRAIVGNASLVHDVQLTAGAGGLSSTADQTVVAGTRVRVEFTNQRDSPVTLSAPGAQSVEVPARQTRWFAFDVPGTGNVTLEAEGVGSVRFQGIQAETISIDLGAYRLLPEEVRLKPHTTYLITSRNVHSDPHNIYIGNYKTNAVAQSATIGAGQTTSVIYRTGDAGTVDMWCNVPGHDTLGMVGRIVVA